MLYYVYTCSQVVTSSSLIYRNLQAAVGAYYDFYGPVTIPTMTAKDVTLSPGQRVPPNTALSKIWRVTNTGTVPGSKPSNPRLQYHIYHCRQ